MLKGRKKKTNENDTALRVKVRIKEWSGIQERREIKFCVCITMWRENRYEKSFFSSYIEQSLKTRVDKYGIKKIYFSFDDFFFFKQIIVDSFFRKKNYNCYINCFFYKQN